MTRALVSGAAGFLGSHLSEALLRAGWEVIGVDDLSTGRAENLATFREDPRFTFLRRDLTEPATFPPVDFVFHLASPASPPHYQRRPIATLSVNSTGTAQLLAHARESGARFLLASTSEVYGDPEVHPQPESYWGHVNPTGPRSCYDEGKRFAEALTMAWHRERGLDVRIARIFNTYGPRMRPDDGRVMSNFFLQGWKGLPLTIHGTGLQTRSFCYVDDLVRGLMALMEATSVDGPVNLGNPDFEVTVLELAQRIRALTGGRSKLAFVERPTDDPERRRPDIARARTLLHWEPSTPLDEGLRATSEYFRERAGGEVT